MASKPGQSPWLEMVQRFERAIGEPIEAFVRSDAYFDVMTEVNRARARLTRTFEGAWEEWLHIFNLPAATDIRRLREQVARMERQVNQIAKNLADLEEAAQETPPKRSRTRASTKPSGRSTASKQARSGSAAKSRRAPAE